MNFFKRALYSIRGFLDPTFSTYLHHMAASQSLKEVSIDKFSAENLNKKDSLARTVFHVAARSRCLNMIPKKFFLKML